MAKDYTPRSKPVTLDVDEWLDIAFALRIAREINLSPKQIEGYDTSSQSILKNHSARYLKIAEQIESQVHGWA